jgi:DNA helicase-2/ATP-dependent DNA helicase PcrA
MAGVDMLERSYAPVQLNPQQMEAVLAPDGPLLVLAGAGTGKTGVLVARIKHLVDDRAVYPSRILAITFTNKAAREMQERVLALAPNAEGIWLGTFHAMAARMLRRHAELVGLTSSFTIVDADDQLRLVKQIMQSMGMDDSKPKTRAMLGILQRWKDYGLWPEKVLSGSKGARLSSEALRVYEQYQAQLRAMRVVDFGDLLLYVMALFQEHPDILAEYQQKFDHVLVDEYQDTSVVQYAWLRMLVAGRGNVCCVGDDDQSIYGWRGAEVGNILRFEQDFPDARIVRLEQNYRSTPAIVAAASAVIDCNRTRLPKKLWTESKSNDLVKVMGVYDDRHEARMVADSIEAMVYDGARSHGFHDMAILVRAGFQTRIFEELFTQRGIPYRVIGGLRFYDRSEIRDVIAYIRLVHMPQDDLAFSRIVNVPRRQIGSTTLEQIRQSAMDSGISLLEAATRMVAHGTMSLRARPSIARFIEQLGSWRDIFRRELPSEATRLMLVDAGYLAMLESDGSDESRAKRDNVEELLRSLDDFTSLEQFLEHASLVSEERQDGQRQSSVTLMTMHAAKGLEFPCVFLPGWEEGLFPHARSLNDEDEGELEEERRLAYVAITRARSLLWISYAANRRMHGAKWQASRPSRFIAELPKQYIDHWVDPSVARAQQQQAKYGGELRSIHQGGWSSSSSWSNSGRQTANDAWLAPEPRAKQRVRHAQFGEGVVMDATDLHAEVLFDSGARRRILRDFLEFME